MSLKNHGKIWTIDDLKSMVDQAHEHVTIQEIAEGLGRTPKACATKLHQILFRCGEKRVIIHLYLLRIPNKIYNFDSTIFFQKRAIRKRSFNI